jgi:S1-C subfamily serine protease
VSSIASKVDPALVDINSTFTYQSAAGAGTGIVLTSNGEILTNNHVVDGATKISVTDIGNGKTYAATVVGYDPSEDIAVLQLVDASGLTTATIGNSADVKVGEPVVGIGNAGGAGGTPTSAGGAVTALDKDITAADDLDGTDEQLEGLFAVNADIQAGDSGGALVDTAGQVIGIDVAGSSSSSFPVSGTTSSPQGFAIPINDAISTAKQIEAGRGSSLVHIGGTAFLGLLISSSNTEGGPEGGSFGGNNTYFGNSGNTGETSTSGAAVGSVVSGDPAASAGITGGDVITSLAGKTVTSATSLSTILIGYHPGQKVQIAWTSGTGQTQTATITLASGPPA